MSSDSVQAVHPTQSSRFHCGSGVNQAHFPCPQFPHCRPLPAPARNCWCWLEGGNAGCYLVVTVVQVRVEDLRPQDSLELGQPPGKILLMTLGIYPSHQCTYNLGGIKPSVFSLACEFYTVKATVVFARYCHCISAPVSAAVWSLGPFFPRHWILAPHFICWFIFVARYNHPLNIILFVCLNQKAFSFFSSR